MGFTIQVWFTRSNCLSRFQSLTYRGKTAIILSNLNSTKCPQTFSLGTASGAGRSEAERSCLNTGDGCKRILSLNDGQRGAHAITTSQPVYQSQREEEKRREAEEKIGLSRKRQHLNCGVILFAVSLRSCTSHCCFHFFVSGKDRLVGITAWVNISTWFVVALLDTYTL